MHPTNVTSPQPRLLGELVSLLARAGETQCCGIISFVDSFFNSSLPIADDFTKKVGNLYKKITNYGLFYF